jgi:hypothetical protein
MASNAVVVSVGADISDLVAKLAIGKQQVADAAREMKNLAKEVVAGGEGAAAARDRIADLASKFEGANRNVVNLSDKLKAARASTDDVGKASGLARYQVQQLGLQMNDAATMALSGSGAFQILATQGGQVLQILQGAEGGLKGALGSIASGVVGLLTPTNLAIGAFGALGLAGAYGLYRITTEANAAKAAVQSMAGAIAAAGNAGNFKNFTADVEEFVRKVGPAAQTRGGLYFAGTPLAGARTTLTAAEAQEYGSRVGAMKDASKELLDAFGEVALGIKAAFPAAEFKDRADTVVKALEDPDKAAKALMETMHALSAAEKERIGAVLRDGDLGDKRAEALALVAEKMRQERSATVLSAEAQRVKALGAKDASGAMAQLVSDEDKLLSSGQRLSPMEGLLSDEFSRQIREVNTLADAMSRLADSMRAVPQTIEGALAKAASLADRLGTVPSQIEQIESNLRTLRGGVGAAPVAAATSERDLLIRTVYGEAGGEGERGQAAVASVIRNRLQSGRFGGSLTDVISAPGQFNGSPTDARYGGAARALEAGSAQYEAIARIVDQVLFGIRPDPTGGALNFYNPSASAPDWGAGMSGKTRIGSHVFGTVGAPFHPAPTQLPGQTPEQFERTTAAIEEQEDAHRRLQERKAGGSAIEQAEYEVARRNAEGKKDELKDEEKRLAALEKQKAATNDLKEQNDLQLQIDKKRADLGEKKLALAQAETRAEIARVGSSDPQKKRDLQVQEAMRDRDRYAPGTEGYIAANARIEAADRELAQARAALARATAEYEIARRNAEGQKDDLKDEQQRLAVLQQQRDATSDLAERNKLGLEIDRKQIEIGEKKLALQRAENQAEIARVGASDPQKKRDLQVQEAMRDRDRYAPGTEGYIAANARIEAADRELAQARASIARSSAESRYQIAHEALQREEQAIRQAAQDGKITKDQEVRALSGVIARREQLELQHLGWLQQNVYQNDALNFAAMEDRKTAALAKAAADRRQLELSSRREIEQGYRQSFGQIGDSVSQSIAGMIGGTANLRDSVRGILLQMIQSFIQGRVRMVTDWLAGVATQVGATTAGEAAKTSAVAAGTAARTGLETSAAATSGLSIVSGILKSIFASAAQVFAGIFGFLSPVMGPAAVGPALAGQATVLGVASALPAFDVGTWELGSDMIAKVHKGEMIVPAGPAAAWRAALDGGPVGGVDRRVVHVNVTHAPTINAVDGASVKRMYRDSEKVLLRQLNDAARRGAHLGLSQLDKT